MALPWRDLPSFPLRELPLQQVPCFKGVSQAYHPHSVTALQSPSLIGGREANRVRGGPDRGGCLCWEGGGQGQQASAEEGQRGPRGRGHTGAKLSNPSEHTGPEWREVLHGWSLGWAQRWGQWVRVRLGQQGPGHLRLGAQWSLGDPLQQGLLTWGAQMDVGVGCVSPARRKRCHRTQLSHRISQHFILTQRQIIQSVTKRLKCGLRSVQPVSVCVCISL